MILFVSGRCDIPAYYSEWFFNRLQAGFVDVRNPYDQHQISRIMLNTQNVDALIFCTKNPIPIMKRLHEVPFPYLFHVTLTPYKEDIERLPNKREILEATIQLAYKIGKKHIAIRYDPIFLSDIYTLDYHIRAFTKLAQQIEGHIDTVVISFIDMYKNTRRNMERMHMKEMGESDMHAIGKALGKIAERHHIRLQTCAEQIDLRAYGIVQGACIDRLPLENIVGHSLSHIQTKGVRNTCHCMATVDIGDYNCCAHGCLYCYANYQANEITLRMKQHDPQSSVLIGHVGKDDRIIERKEKVVRQASLFSI